VLDCSSNLTYLLLLPFKPAIKQAAGLIIAERPCVRSKSNLYNTHLHRSSALMLDQKSERSCRSGKVIRVLHIFVLVEGGVCVCFRETEMMWFKKQIRVHYI
jgi:hypothetical protein